MISIHELQASLFPLLIIFSILQDLPICFSQNDTQKQEVLQWYNSCGSLFTCGHLSVSFPFWGGSRPSKCGHPSLQLNCNTTKNITTIDIKRIQYRVLDIDLSDATLKISRQDLFSGICNITSFDDTLLDFSIFDYEAGYNNISILYGCPSDGGGGYGSYSITESFNCSSIKGTNFTSGQVASDAQTAASLGCAYDVLLPIEASAASNLSTETGLSSLEESIQDGFVVYYKVDNVACIACEATEGRCGYDWNKNATNCVCSDGSIGTDNKCGVITTSSGDNATGTVAQQFPKDDDPLRTMKLPSN